VYKILVENRVEFGASHIFDKEKMEKELRRSPENFREHLISSEVYHLGLGHIPPLLLPVIILLQQDNPDWVVGVLIWVLAEVGTNIYPIILLRSTRARIEALIERFPLEESCEK